MMSTGGTLAQAQIPQGASMLSLAVLLLMGAATVVLIWNMNGRLKKLPSSFPPAADDEQSPEQEREERPAG